MKVSWGCSFDSLSNTFNNFYTSFENFQNIWKYKSWTATKGWFAQGANVIFWYFVKMQWKDGFAVWEVVGCNWKKFGLQLKRSFGLQLKGGSWQAKLWLSCQLQSPPDQGKSLSTLHPNSAHPQFSPSTILNRSDLEQTLIGPPPPRVHKIAQNMLSQKWQWGMKATAVVYHVSCPYSTLNVYCLWVTLVWFEEKTVEHCL